jgi:hypothetical protein
MPPAIGPSLGMSLVIVGPLGFAVGISGMSFGIVIPGTSTFHMGFWVEGIKRG